MKRNFAILTLLLVFLCLLPGCNAQSDTSVKTFTQPYINKYECTKARFGEDDLLKRFEYINVLLLENDVMEIRYKTKNGEKRTIEGEYSVDDENELTCDIGFAGYKFKESVKIKDGKFKVSTVLFSRLLYMEFAVV